MKYNINDVNVLLPHTHNTTNNSTQPKKKSDLDRFNFYAMK